MANEITVIEQAGADLALVFLYPIATPLQVGGANVVPTPSVGLPALAAVVFQSAEKAALDAGTAAFEVVSLTPDPALSPAQLLARAKVIYAAALAAFTSAYQLRYRWSGQRFTYP